MGHFGNDFEGVGIHHWLIFNPSKGGLAVVVFHIVQHVLLPLSDSSMHDVSHMLVDFVGRKLKQKLKLKAAGGLMEEES
jgi:hypothetical protein